MASRSAIAFCQTVGASVTRTVGSSRAVPYSSNQGSRWLGNELMGCGFEAESCWRSCEKGLVAFAAPSL